jgi:hypothetical protein
LDAIDLPAVGIVRILPELGEVQFADAAVDASLLDFRPTPVRPVEKN